jgi:hypothetical protein
MYFCLFQPFIVCTRKNIEMWDYCLSLGGGATAVGLVHELTRSNFLDYKYFYVMARTKVLFGR